MPKSYGFKLAHRLHEIPFLCKQKQLFILEFALFLLTLQRFKVKR